MKEISKERVNSIAGLLIVLKYIEKYPPKVIPSTRMHMPITLLIILLLRLHPYRLSYFYN